MRYNAGTAKRFGFAGNLAAQGTYIEATGGTTIQLGDYRYHIFNSTDTFTVTSLSSIAANNELRVLVVGGGGGGGGHAYGGGGGGGAVLENLSYLLSTTGSIPVVVGAGGAGGTAINDITNQGVNGSDSSFLTLSRLGGGGGGGYLRVGSSGGNGGGGNGGSSRAGGAGTQGFAGSAGQQVALTNYRGGGGGGASQIGQTSAVDKTGSNGGAGIISAITGSYYGGGGAGGSGDNPGAVVGVGGIGGGGGSTTALSGTSNTGGGGAGATYAPATTGGNGGSGIIIIGYYYVDATGWDSQTEIVSDRMTSLGSTPSDARYNKMNTLIKNLKGEGFFGTVNVWNKLDILQPYYAETAIQSLVEWKMKDGAGVYDATTVNSPVFTANGGYLTNPDGLRYIRTNFAATNGTNYTQNTNCFGAFLKNTVLGAYLCGSNNNTFKCWIRMSWTDNTGTDQRNNGPTSTNGHYGVVGGDGLFLSNRHSSTAFKTIRDTTIYSTCTSTATGRDSSSFVVTGYAAGMNTSLSNAFFFIAGGDLEADRSQLYNSLLAYIS